MRVLHVTPSFYPAHLYGGPVVSLHGLACAQVRAGHQVRVLTSDANGPGQRLAGLGGRWVEDHGVPTYYAPVSAGQDLSLALLARLPGLLRWAEVVHVTAVFSPTSLMALSLAAALRKPVVLSPRGSLLPWALGGSRRGGKRAVLGLLRPVLRHVRGWHATSDEEAEALRRLPCVAPGAAVAVVGNGLDLEAAAPADADGARPVAAGEGPILTMLGRIDPIKGIDLGIAALALLRRTHPRAVLLLVGPDRDGHGAGLRALAAAVGVAEAVRFVGLVTGPQKAALLRASDVLLFCSRMESFGNVVVESLYAGTPVVAVQTTPWAWLEAAGLGRFVAPTAAAVAEAAAGLLSLHADPAAHAAWAARARAQVAARFSWPAITAQMDALYAAALHGPGDGAKNLAARPASG